MIAFLLFLGLQAEAIEYQFDGGQVTALGGVTNQSAGLGYLNQKYTFAASATSLEFTKFNIKNNSFEQSNSPMSFTPVFVGSALSTSYGGWSLLIQNAEREYRAVLDTVSGGDITNSDITLRVKAFSALVSAGLRLHQNWSIGWGIEINQAQVESSTETYNRDAGIDIFTVSKLSQQNTSSRVHMGMILSFDEFVLGLNASTPSILLARAGKLRTRTLISTTNTYTDTVENEKMGESSDWNLEAGLRFGRSGFSYVLSDDYTTDGQHVFKGGFEYVGSWGSVVSGFTHSEFKNVETSSITVGFVKDHKNFKWGVGPFYREDGDSTPGAINSTSFGVLYSSEIRY